MHEKPKKTRIHGGWKLGPIPRPPDRRRFWQRLSDTLGVSYAELERLWREHLALTAEEEKGRKE